VPFDPSRARRHLAKVDPVLAALIRRAGPCGFASGPPDPPFPSLLRMIVGQQLSVSAARTIHGRVLALFPDGRPTPAALLAIDDDTLRGAGLSRPKLRYMRDLSERVLDGRLDLETVEALPDDEVIGRLVQVKGIGRWTAEIFLMFHLHRPDVLPADDLGIVRAVQQVYGLRRRPSATRILAMGEPWRPYRSVASWYLWRSLELPR
jgi:DNA-3-methyladenine glycosylase II